MLEGKELEDFLNDLELLQIIIDTGNLGKINEIKTPKFANIINDALNTDAIELMEKSEQELFMYLSERINAIDLTSISIEDAARLLETAAEIEEQRLISIIKSKFNSVSSKRRTQIIEQLIDKNNIDAISYLWEEIDDSVQDRYIENILELPNDNYRAMENIWGGTNEKVQKNHFATIMENIDLNKIGFIWRLTNYKVQKEHFESIIRKIEDTEKENSFNSILFFWERTHGKVQKKYFESILEKAQDNRKCIIEMWEKTHEEAQKEHFKKVLKKMQDDKNDVFLIWSKTTEEAKKKHFNTVLENMDNDKGSIFELWETSSVKVQKEHFKSVFNKIQNDIGDIIGIWAITTEEVQKENFQIIFAKLKNDPNSILSMWESTAKEVQKENFLSVFEELKNDLNSILSMWKNTPEEVQREFFSTMYAQIQNNNRNIRDIEQIKAFLKTSHYSLVSKIWDDLSKEEQKDSIGAFIEHLNSNPESCGYLPVFLKEKVSKDIDADKLAALLSIRDIEFVHKHIIEKILIQNIEDNEINIKEANLEIGKLYNIFLTNNLPEVFKIFQFFRLHDNHQTNNPNLYEGKSIEERDRIILGDLILSDLDSDNNQMKNFLKLLHNGDIAFRKKNNGYELESFEKAILLAYENSIKNLYEVFKDEELEEDLEGNDLIKNIRERMQIGEKENLGDCLLSALFEKLSLKIEDGKKVSIKSLLEYMQKRREEAIKRNAKEINLRSILEVRRFNKRNRHTIFEYTA